MKGYRTLLINLFLAIAPVLQTTGAADLGLDGRGAEAYAILITVVNIGLRFVTTTQVGRK